MNWLNWITSPECIQNACTRYFELHFIYNKTISIWRSMISTSTNFYCNYNNCNLYCGMMINYILTISFSFNKFLIESIRRHHYEGVVRYSCCGIPSSLLLTYLSNGSIIIITSKNSDWMIVSQISSIWIRVIKLKFNL